MRPIRERWVAHIGTGEKCLLTDLSLAAQFGFFLVLFLLAEPVHGAVVAWGDNAYHQTNVPSGLAGAKKIAAGYWHTLALKSTRTVVAWGINDYGQTNVPFGITTNAIAIAAGRDH